jgi:tetratricopeptide (TPR) repeat protein
MAMSSRLGLILPVLLAVCATGLRAQLPPPPADHPGVFVPLHGASRAELDRREARSLYAMGLLRQRQDRLLDALRLLEESRKLDPDAPASYRALVPLYLALGRHEDALTGCRKVLELDPADLDTWYLYARQLREDGRPKEALEALKSGIASPNAKDQLDILVQMHYDRAVLHEEAKEFGPAEASYREVIKILVDRRAALLDAGPFNPDQLNGEAAKTYEHLGQICLKLGKHEQAIDAFVQAQKRDPEHTGRLNLNLAEVCIARGKSAEALPYLDEYLKTQPQDTKPYEMKIEILKKLGREREVLPALHEYAERDAFNVALHLLLAKQYGLKQQWDEAEKLYLKLAEQTPSGDVYRGLFDLYKDREKNRADGIGKVLEQLDKAMTAAAPKDEEGAGDAAAAARARAMLTVLRDDPDLVKKVLNEAVSHLRGGPDRSRVTLRLLAGLAARANQLDHAERLYKRCLDGVGPGTEAEVYGGLLDVLSDLGKYDEVVKYSKQGLRTAQATNRLVFYLKLANAYVHLDKPTEAVAAAEEAVKVADDRNRLFVHRLKVSILSQLEFHDDAIKEAQAMLKDFTQPGEVRDVRYTLSGAFSAAKQHAKAEEQLRMILEADPNDATANNDLGYIMADQGKNLEESEKLIRKAIELDREEKKTSTEVRSEGEGDNAAYLDSLGWVLFRRGQLKEAREWLEKASALPGGSDDPVVWDHLGDVCARQKEPARARAAWEKALQLYEQEKRRKQDDRYKEVKQKLKELRN